MPYSGHKMAVSFSAFIINACTMVDLPPVPENRPYQAAVLAGSADHGQGDLTIAAPENRPPYFDGVHNNGIERDILRESFEAVGLHPEFMMTSERHKKFDTEQFSVECVTTVTPSFKLKSEVYFSDTVILYHYTPFTLKKSGVVINDYSDMTGKIVEAFASAESYLGPKFLESIPKMLIYSKHINRTSQVALLLRDHIDVLIMDRLMFRATLKRLRQLHPADYSAEVVEVPVEQVVEFKLGCHKPTVIAEFNKGLAMLRANHRYEEIFKQYLTE